MNSSPRKILILSITRMGDIIQSIPFVRRLRCQHPDAQICLLVENAFREVAGMVPEVDQVIEVRLEDLLPCLGDGQGEGALRTYRDLVRMLRAEEFDAVWNLTHTRPATVLNFVLAGASGLGVTLDHTGLQLVNAPWLRYFFATNLARPWCQINLVDIYANCVTDVPWDFGRSLQPILTPQVSGILSEIPWSRHRQWVAIHPGASQASKQWPRESFAAVARSLTMRSDLGVLLVGSSSDRKLSDQILHAVPVFSLVGRTSPSQLAEVLSRCDLLISNDSGPVHVAAAVGTPVIAVTVGSALGSETAPYGNGHIVIEPDAECFPCSPHGTCDSCLCGRRICPGTVGEIAEWVLQKQPEGFRLRSHDGARIYRTQFSERDGLLELFPLFNTAPNERDELNGRIRPAWLQVLSARTFGRELLPSLPNEVLQLAATTAAEVVRHCGRVLRTMEEYALQLPQSATRLQQQAAELRSLDEQLEAVMDRHGLLKSFLAYAWLSKCSLVGVNPAEQARESSGIYRDLASLLSALLRNVPADLATEHTGYNSIGASHDNRSQWTRALAES